MENCLEDISRQQDKILRTANSFHVRGYDKYTRSVQRIFFMIAGGRIPSIREMTMDEYGLRSMENIDPRDLRMSSNASEKKGLMSSGKTIEHASMYGTDLSDEENAESMMRMFVGIPTEVITQGVSKIHEEFSKFFCAEYFDNESDNISITAWDSAMYHRYSESLCSGHQ